MFKKLFLLTLIAYLFVLFSACRPKTVTIDDPWMRSGNKGNNAAIYLTIKNSTDWPVNLISANVDKADETQIHMSMTASNGMTSMQHQQNVTIPANDEVKFEPGGLHIMLIGLKDDIREGEKINITLNFEGIDAISLEVPVENR